MDIFLQARSAFFSYADADGKISNSSDLTSCLVRALASTNRGHIQSSEFAARRSSTAHEATTILNAVGPSESSMLALADLVFVSSAADPSVPHATERPLRRGPTSARGVKAASQAAARSTGEGLRTGTWSRCAMQAFPNRTKSRQHYCSGQTKFGQTRLTSIARVQRAR
jgi:hypothetical protein